MEEGTGYQRLIYGVRVPSRTAFSSRAVCGSVAVTLYRGLPRVEVEAHLSWEAFSHRLRVAVPVPIQGRHLYGIPYGIIERKPYEPQFYHWAAANGDWPAINWAGVEGQRWSVALLNKGIPSYCIETEPSGGSVMLMTLLRSPMEPTYLHEPDYYSMTAWTGMRDAGEHDFEYAIVSYPGPLYDSDVVLDAEAYNGGLLTARGLVALPEGPVVHAESVRLAALKWAQEGDSAILRLVEYRGKGGRVRVSLPNGVIRAARVNLIEEPIEPLEIKEQSVQLVLRSWEIATLRLEMNR
jgi:alpha-mannosidase